MGESNHKPETKQQRKMDAAKKQAAKKKQVDNEAKCQIQPIAKFKATGSTYQKSIQRQMQPTADIKTKEMVKEQQPRILQRRQLPGTTIALHSKA